MSKRIVFVHGWGLAADFWGALAGFFPGRAHDFVNLGFFGQENIPPVSGAIYVTHSLGSLWALKNCAAQIQGLVAINGFTSFRRFASKAVLAKMKAGLQEDPENYMVGFHKTIGAASGKKPLNPDRLAEGLDWLADWDERATLKNIEGSVLVLAGGQDEITPLPQMQKEWAGHDLHVQPQGGHALPHSHAQWCAELIKDVLA